MSECYPTWDKVQEELEEELEGRRDPWIWRHALTYLRMAAEANYRPAAPSDGLGNIQLDDNTLALRDQLEREAFMFGIRCVAEEKKLTVHYGCVDCRTGEASRLAVEAAKCLNAGEDINKTGVLLLRMALRAAEREATKLEVTPDERERAIAQALYRVKIHTSRPPKDKKDKVYFILGHDSFKIGHGLDPAQRLRDMQTGNPDTLELLGWIYSDVASEPACWAAAEKCGFKKIRGEWFDGVISIGDMYRVVYEAAK